MKKPLRSFIKRLLIAGILTVASSTAWAAGRRPFAPVFSVDPSTVTAGRTFCVFMETKAVFDEASVSFRKHRARFYRLPDGRWRALLGVHSLEEPGPKHAFFHAKMKEREFRTTVDFSVQPGTYPVSKVTLSKERDKLVDKMARDSKILEDVYKSTGDPQKHWSGFFIFPATGIVSSVYGARRQYGERRWSSPHSGTDVANVLGTAITAPNRGRVAYAGWLECFGNVVVLDHGQGVYSYYLHMTQALAKKDDFLEKGAPLGLMGAEGIATGPHVHWSFVVNGERVDPLEWTQREVP